MTACVIVHKMIVEEKHDDNIYDQGWEFQGELVAIIMNRHRFRSFLMHIMRFEIGQTATSFKKIWLIIFEFMWERTRNQHQKQLSVNINY
jgi:hypothetical protein